jgi:Uma2 family endonuclease
MMSVITITDKMTFQEFLAHEFTDQELQEGWYELINGQMRRRNYPTILHQQTSGHLFVKMYNFVTENKLGKVFHPPTGVILGEHNVVLPDLVFVSNAQMDLIQETGIFGSPELVVEIISPSTLKDDRNDKKDLYWQFEVKEYWLIDPQYASIEVFEWTEKGYKLFAFAVEEGKITSQVLKELELKLEDVFAK